MNKSELERIHTLLKVSSSLSSLEMPSLLIAALALIPGFFEETIVGVSAIALFAMIALGRHYLVNNRDKYLQAIEEAYNSHQIDEIKYKESIKALNTLTVEGGTQANT